MAKNVFSNERIRKISGTALFSAFAYLFVFFLHIKVAHLTFDPKDAVFAMCGMVFGPIWAVVSSLIVTLLEMATFSTTGIIGLVMNFISSASFAFFVSVIYRWRRNYFGAVTGLLTSVTATTAVMLGANLLITPVYFRINGVSMGIGDVAATIPTLLLPFNLIKAVFNAGIVLLFYKPVSAALKKAKILPRGENAKVKPLLTVLSTVAALLIITAAVLYLFFVLNGQFEAVRVPEQ